MVTLIAIDPLLRRLCRLHGPRTPLWLRSVVGIRAATLCASLYPMPTLAAERPPGFVALADVVPTIVQDMRYAGSNNFTGRPVPGYGTAACWLRKDAVEALAKVQASLRDEGFGLIVYDCYRPKRATAAFLRWSADPRDTLKQADFYPRVAKQTLFRRGFIAAISAHSTGLAVDVGLVRRDTSMIVDMGTPFDLFDVRSATKNPDVSARAHVCRTRLVAAMAAAGFKKATGEWWHFALHGSATASTWDVPIE